METLEKDKEAEKIKKRNEMIRDGVSRGEWKLEIKLTNKMGIEGFSGRMIGPFKDPHTGKEIFPEKPDGTRKAGVWLDSTMRRFKPAEEIVDLLDLDFLVRHPYIGVNNEHVKLDAKYMKKKPSNPLITLTNLDHEDLTDIENEQYIDQLIGYISEEKGGKKLDLDRTRYILNSLNLQYRDAKLTNDSKKETSKLKHILKKYVRSSIDNAKKVNKILDNLKFAELKYQIAEMIRLDVIQVEGAVYAYNGRTIGISEERVMNYFEKNPEFYKEIKAELYEALRNE